MNIRILPRTRLGKLTVGSMIICIVLVLAFFAMVTIFGQRGGETFFSNLYLTIPMLIAFAAGCAAFILGILSMIISKDRAVLVIVITILGFLVLLYGTAEVAFPH